MLAGIRMTGTIDGTAVATFLLALGTFGLAWMTRKMVDAAVVETRQTREALKVARDQAAAAQRQSVEAVKSRIDARAPRVTVVLGPADYPIRAVSASNSADAAHRFVGSQEFVLPGDGPTRLMMRTIGFLRNEGMSTAVVTMSNVATFFEATFWPSGDEPNGPVHPVPPALGGGRYAIGPGEGAMFTIEDVRTVEDWALAWDVHHGLAASEGSTSLWLEVIVTDTFDDGIADNIMLQMQSFPLEPTPHNAAGWTMRDAPKEAQMPAWSAPSVRPTRRRYYASKMDDTLLTEPSAEP